VENGRQRRTTAMATAALCVGGMVVARALVDRTLADELREEGCSLAAGIKAANRQLESSSGPPLNATSAPLRHRTLN
jgi:hypothetical protein